MVYTLLNAGLNAGSIWTSIVIPGESIYITIKLFNILVFLVEGKQFTYHTKKWVNYQDY
jgi:hypothetical protein